MIATHSIETISFTQENIILRLDGKEISLPLDKISNKLKVATEVERNLYSVSPSGYGIHWPLIDEDLSVDSLLKSANTD